MGLSQCVYPFYLFILAISFSKNSSVLIRFPSSNHFFICQLSKMIKNKKSSYFQSQRAGINNLQSNYSNKITDLHI